MNLATTPIRQCLWAILTMIFISFFIDCQTKNEVSVLCSSVVPEKLKINLWFLSCLQRSFQIRRKRWIVSSLPSEIGTMILILLIWLDLWICIGFLRIWIIWFVTGNSIGKSSRKRGLSNRYVEMNCLVPWRYSGVFETGRPFWTMLKIKFDSSV